jgi:hypothetical protein
MILSQLFDHIAYMKPITSRPATGELYIICRGLRDDLTEDHRTDLMNALWTKIDLIEEIFSKQKECSDQPQKVKIDIPMGTIFLPQQLLYLEAAQYCYDVNMSLLLQQVKMNSLYYNCYNLYYFD